jgi:hypothetical protein
MDVKMVKSILFFILFSGNFSVHPMGASNHFFHLDKNELIIAKVDSTDKNAKVECYLLTSDNKVVETDFSTPINNSCSIAYTATKDDKYHIEVLNLGKKTIDYNIEIRSGK